MKGFALEELLKLYQDMMFSKTLGILLWQQTAM
jgi:hypothetical protein